MKNNNGRYSHDYGELRKQKHLLDSKDLNPNLTSHKNTHKNKNSFDEEEDSSKKDTFLLQS